MISRRSVLQLASAMGINLSGCGLLLYPERRGQPLGRLDWTVVALDTIGLCFFFVPGVIAFAVDFATGAIFLPGEGVATTEPGTKGTLIKHTIPRHLLSRPKIEQVVSQHARQSIRLQPGEYELYALDQIEDFWSKRDQLLSEQS